MRKNGFYLIVGCITSILLIIFWYSIETHSPLVISIAFIIGVGLAYFARSRVTDLVEDERSARITEKAVLRTFQIFWVLFGALSIGEVMNILSPPRFPRPFPEMPPPPAPIGFRAFGYMQLVLLCLMIFLYVGFRIYYARKFGEWETDEE
jgi:uncharacterized membrane protein